MNSPKKTVTDRAIGPDKGGRYGPYKQVLIPAVDGMQG